jgi:AraC family transcriptional regulator, regulatory protein of adaptative response / DNA-3-methyladenine glycosylase II
MTLDQESCYRALSARDPRFDGLFFVGVTSTGIYCRPVCPARLPRRDRCHFYGSQAAAEQAGFRPCLRCRPELAPGRASVDSASRLAGAAAARIAAGALNQAGVEDLARELFVGARQLRRALRREYGVGPAELAQTNRLLLAKRLLGETELSMTEVAFASGFSSVRRFNGLFRERYGLAPGELRRSPGGGALHATLSLTLPFRPPLDWEALLTFLAGRATPGVEVVEGGRYRRTLVLGGHRGHLAVGPDEGAKHALRVEVSHSLAPVLMPLLSRLRTLFDLDAEPDRIAGCLERDPVLGPRVRRHPGLRVPGAVDGFELAVRAVLGQQVSVQAATTLAGRLAHAFGEPAETGHPGLTRYPVAAERLAAAEPEQLLDLGVTRARAHCIIGLAAAAAAGELRLEPGADVDGTIETLQALPGIGPWTAQYIAMRALHWPDAFPHTDLMLKRAFGTSSAAELLQAAEAWRPWRAYAALHLWNSLASTGRPELTPTSEAA